MDDIFEKEMRKATVFKDRNVISPHYIPETLPHREKEIERMMKALAPSLRCNNYNNLFIYGKTGTGKTSSTRRVIEKLMAVKEKYNANVDAVYVNCRTSDTKYQVFLKITEHFFSNEQFNGFALQHLIDKCVSYIGKKNTNVVVVLDELDMVKNLDDLMYALTRMNDELKSGHMGIIGITNNLFFKEQLDPRSKSTLCEEELVFAPYDADQIKEILTQRAKMGYKENAISPTALSFAAALAAQESGDARYALDLLLKAGDVADSEGSPRITEEHLQKARKTAEDDKVFEAISKLPEHQKVVLYAIALLTTDSAKYQRLDGSTDDKVLFSGEVYEKYERVCHTLGKDPRSARWAREYINELDMLGLITTSVSGKGVRGNTTLIRLTFAPEKVKNAVEKSMNMET